MQSLSERFHTLKQKLLEKRFSNMNEMQKKAVFQVKGPLLILAGAGSGKTTVLVNRIAYLLNYGNAYHDDLLDATAEQEEVDALQAMESEGEIDDARLRKALRARPVNPWNVLAITFTNKAANEMKDRLFGLLGDDGLRVNAGTFHYICLRILRREIEALGYGKGFTIYDTDDSQRVLRDCLADLNLDEKMFPVKSVLHTISNAKDAMLSPEDFARENEADFRNTVIGNIYALYQKRMKASNAVDFDDIICLTVRLLKEYPDVLDHYQNLYQYILVDEYQDTNHAQYELVSLLSGKYQNLCVVGDDDQSIYRFRGATIENILSFEHEFDNAVVIRLEQNYRSTQNILDAANELIKNNVGRKGKKLWTDNGQGPRAISYRAPDETAEANFVVKQIEEDVHNGMRFSDHAVLYRMNAQSATIEKQLVRSGIPYKIVGGTKFFERKEIRDILAYFHVLDNPSDTVRLKRIINEPKRGIGDTTVKNVEAISEQLGIPMYEVLRRAGEFEVLPKHGETLLRFVGMLDELRDMSLTSPLSELLDVLMEKTGYADYLKSQGREGETRLENVAELKTNLIRYTEENEEPSLQGFLEEVSLFTDLDNLNADDDSVILMTIHSAKGLEFKSVFIVGMEENIFPSYQSAQLDDSLEEERRLAYVAVTRAKKQLYITNSSQRMLFGRTSRNIPSRFLKEIPEELLEIIDETTKAYGFQKRPEKAKPVYVPEIEGTVGVHKAMEEAPIDYTVGDRVEHKVFGIGRVRSMTPMSNDVLVEVEFEKKGVKKIMANFARLKKID